MHPRHSCWSAVATLLTALAAALALLAFGEPSLIATPPFAPF